MFFKKTFAFSHIDPAGPGSGSGGEGEQDRIGKGQIGDAKEGKERNGNDALHLLFSYISLNIIYNYFIFNKKCLQKPICSLYRMMVTFDASSFSRGR